MSKFKFQPDLKAEDSPLSNAQRADNGMECVKPVFDFAENDIETAISDAVANMFHLCDKEGVDVKTVLHQAVMHWDAERGEVSDIYIELI